MINCRKFEGCSALLCPLADNLPDLIWYPDEDICNRKDFQTVDWIKKQKAIAKVRAPTDRYWTVDMLKAIKQVRKGITGIDPDQPLKQAREAERKWIEEKKGGRVIGEQNQKAHLVIASKRVNLVFEGQASHREKEVKNGM